MTDITGERAESILQECDITYNESFDGVKDEDYDDKLYIAMHKKESDNELVFSMEGGTPIDEIDPSQVVKIMMADYSMESFSEQLITLGQFDKVLNLIDKLDEAIKNHNLSMIEINPIFAGNDGLIGKAFRITE